jgi:hypothetical protein
MPKLAHGRSRLPVPNDPRILRAIYKATLKGHSIDVAATYARIGAMTARDWYSTGMEQLETWDGSQSPAELGSHALFAWTVKAAEVAMQDHCVDVVDASIDKGQWLAAMTKLDRRNRRDWGQRPMVEVHNESQTLILQGTMPDAVEHELIAQAHTRALAAQRQIEAGGASQDEATPPPDTTLPEA